MANNPLREDTNPNEPSTKKNDYLKHIFIRCTEKDTSKFDRYYLNSAIYIYPHHVVLYMFYLTAKRSVSFFYFFP